MTSAQDDNAFLRLEGIRKSFGAVKVIDNLSLSVRRGEFISLLGPSGCGKTTTLRMIAGFVAADAGRIVLDGARIDEVPSHRRGAAMVFQNYALFPHMTVFDNVAFGLRMQKTAAATIASRVAEVLALVRLPDMGQRFPKELSGGQQQRVALARAIVLNPKLLLLDEPLSNLDAKLRKELRAEFVEIHRIAGITTILVTHDIEEAFSVSDRVAVMNAGRVEQLGAPVEIFNRPQTAFVAEFVGHQNAIGGPLRGGSGGGATIDVHGTAIRVPNPAGGGGAARFAIPAHLVRVSPRAQAADNCLAGRLAALNYLGAAIQFQVDLGGWRLDGEAHATADALKLRIGDPVFAFWSAADMIPLPPTSAGPG